MVEVEVEERIGSSYLFCLRTEQAVKPKPRDILRFHFTVTVQYYTYCFWDRFLTGASTLFEITIPISCESFFKNNNHDFVRSILSNPLCSRFFGPESRDQISQRIVFHAQQLLEFSSDPQSVHSESQQEFPLTLAIHVEILEDGEIEESDVTEESMQQSITMIPASNEAIHCLKTFTDSLFLKSENCNICMERFHVEEESTDDEDVKLSSSSSMPCGHVFHHHCIVEWLQTSHMCPLCRYPIPTAKDSCLTYY